MTLIHAIAWLAIVQAPAVESEHARNVVFRDLLQPDFKLDGAAIRLPGPRFRDGQDAKDRFILVREVAGSDEAAKDLVRDSITAPFILKLRDEKLADSTIRHADLWFVVHGDLDAIDPAEAARQAAKPVEVANMRFETKVLGPDQVRSRKLPLAAPDKALSEWYTHFNARLLDRIAIESTDHVVVSRSAESVVIASRSAPEFDRDAEFPNRWATLDRSDPSKPAGAPKPYPGGISYVKISKLGDGSRALIVEGHFAFVEPAAWFDRAPILRSKLAPVAQDQIRRLRRESAAKKPKG